MSLATRLLAEKIKKFTFIGLLLVFAGQVLTWELKFRIMCCIARKIEKNGFILLPQSQNNNDKFMCFL